MFQKTMSHTPQPQTTLLGQQFQQMSLDNSTVQSQATTSQQHLLAGSPLSQQQVPLVQGPLLQQQILLQQQQQQSPQQQVLNVQHTDLVATPQQQQYLLLQSQQLPSLHETQATSQQQHVDANTTATALLLGQQQQPMLDYNRMPLPPQPVLLTGAGGSAPPLYPGAPVADSGVVPAAVGAVQSTIGMMAAVHPTTQTQPPPLLHAHGPHAHHPKLTALMRRQPVVMPPWGVGEAGGFSSMLEHVHEGDENEEDRLETPPNSPTNGQMDVSWRPSCVCRKNTGEPAVNRVTVS